MATAMCCVALRPATLGRQVRLRPPQPVATAQWMSCIVLFLLWLDVIVVMMMLVG